MREPRGRAMPPPYSEREGESRRPRVKQFHNIFVAIVCGAPNSMGMNEYPILMTPDDNGTLLVTCPDLLEVASFGEDEADAVRRAGAAIEEALAARIADREDIPGPSPAAGRATVALPALIAAKIQLYRTARAQGVTKAELRRRLLLHGPQVDRLFDLRHASKIEQIDRALRTMGKRLEVTLRDAA
ncbi:MAG TPA: type II toxin-antitoxin system HicB family antitoxin [Stellaceae bacterium]|nr:type II toxin-antitoxin system HicB family antitoxin [Stellaceae bacterium]